MDYTIEFGRNTNYELIPVYGCTFDGNNPMHVFEHHAKTLKMQGGDFSDMDYIALYENTSNDFHARTPLAIKIIK